MIQKDNQFHCGKNVKCIWIYKVLPHELLITLKKETVLQLKNMFKQKEKINFVQQFFNVSVVSEIIACF